MWITITIDLVRHYNDVIMVPQASQITSLTIVYSAVYSGADQRKASKLCVTGLCTGNSPGTGEFPAQMASNAENISIWWRHHEFWCPNAFAQAVHKIYAIQMYELLSQRQRSSFCANVLIYIKRPSLFGQVSMIDYPDRRSSRRFGKPSQRRQKFKELLL